VAKQNRIARQNLRQRSHDIRLPLFSASLFDPHGGVHACIMHHGVYWAVAR
jgi:hypothetical protein